MDHQGEPLLSCNLEFQTGSSFAEKPSPVKAINHWQQSKTPSKLFTVEKEEVAFNLGEKLLCKLSQVKAIYNWQLYKL